MIDGTEYYEISGVSIVRAITITFPGGVDVVMPSPYAGAIKTYRVFEIVATYVDDLPATWTAGVTSVFKTTPTATRPTIVLRSHTFEDSIREHFGKIVNKLDIRDPRDR